MREEYQAFLKKKVKIVVKINNVPYYYTGKVISVNEDSLTIIDKFNSNVLIKFDDISQIRQVGEWKQTQT